MGLHVPVLLATALGSLQGLYTTSQKSGQLYVKANVSAPAPPVAVGLALTAQGFAVPDDGSCVCAAIDQTRKLHYTLARNASASSGQTANLQWSLVGVELASGAVRIGLRQYCHAPSNAGNS